MGSNIMGCIIEGARCTKCCEAITLPVSRKRLGEMAGEDARFILANWKPMSKRLAKKVNPYLFASVPELRSSKKWRLYRCTALTPDGCGKYDERPPVCRNYPHYGRPGDPSEPEYHPQCTEWVRIDAVEVISPTS